MKNPWKTLSSRKIYKSRWISVREDAVIQPNGEKSMFGVIESKKFVMMIPKIGADFYLINQYRYPIQQFSLEFPAGAIKANEAEKTAVIRELIEETGLKPNKITKIGKLYVACSFSDTTYSIYAVEDFIQCHTAPEASEGKIELQKVSKKQLNELIQMGKVGDSQTLAAFQLYQQQERE